MNSAVTLVTYLVHLETYLKMKRTTRISVFLTPDEAARVGAAADAEGASISMLARRLLLKQADVVVKAPTPASSQPKKTGRPSNFANLGPVGVNNACRGIWLEVTSFSSADAVIAQWKKSAPNLVPTPQEWSEIKAEFKRRAQAGEPLYYQNHPGAGQEWFEPSDPVYWDRDPDELVI